MELAYLLFIAAEFGTWVAVLVYAYGATGPISVGFVAVAQLLPAALLAPFTATLGERIARNRALAVAHGTTGLATIAVGLAMIAGAPPLVVYAIAIVQQLAMTAVRPTQAAILPGLVGTAEQLTAANGLGMIVEGAGTMLGPLAAGVALAVAGPGTAFVAAGIGALAGAVVVARVASSPPTTPAGDRTGGPSAAPEPARAELLAGIRAISRDRSGLFVALLIGVRQIAIGALDVLLVFAAIELYGMGESGAGYLNAALGVGSVLGGASTLALAGRARLAPFLLIGGAGWAVFMLGMTLLQSPTLAFVLLSIASIGLAVLEVTARTLVQRLLPLGALAGAFGVLEAFVVGGIALGALLAAPLVETIGLVPSLALFGILVPIVAAAVLPVVAASERLVHVPLREIALLRRLRLFAPVPAPALEAAARAAIPVHAEPGETIIREGEVGDRFYAIAEGRVLVTQGERELRHLSAGEGFGEIALLRPVRRTATVRAVEPVELLALERADFLLAITGTPDALDEANRVAEGYLERDRGGAPPTAGRPDA